MSQQEHELDLRIAREIQRNLFPRVPRLNGFDISAATHPLNSAAGDFFDFIPMQDGSLGIVVGDAAGHGVGPALLMATTRAYLRALAHTHSDIGEILTIVNKMLCADVGKRFITLFFARLNLEERSLIYADAGHGLCSIIDHSGEVKSLDDVSGPPLGVELDLAYSVSSPIELATGDIIFLPSDGLAEGPHGMKPAIDIIRVIRNRDAHDIVETLFKAVRYFLYPAGLGRPTPTDDGTTMERFLEILDKYEELSIISDDITSVLIKVA
jgi:sigma-B regulation protein RsbU (phosphoserine phosphatase)